LIAFEAMNTPSSVLLLVLCAASVCSAADITYDISQTIGTGGVTGDIVTDGTVGTLATGDIVDWNLLINDGSAGTFDLLGPLSGDNSYLTYDGGLSATASDLSFEFTPGSAIEFSSNPAFADLCLNVNPCVFSPEDAETIYVDGGVNEQFVTFSPETQVVVGTTPEPSTIALIFAGIAFVGLRKPKKLH
jgi:hypothetical protein